MTLNSNERKIDVLKKQIALTASVYHSAVEAKESFYFIKSIEDELRKLILVADFLREIEAQRKLIELSSHEQNQVDYFHKIAS